ncbi:MAG: hypothetical protein PHC93_05765 [Candidatus Omnitrophica bacterium]|nr:hypothetical protein [Candidatus Omnitrophota bacterium]
MKPSKIINIFKIDDKEICQAEGNLVNLYNDRIITPENNNYFKTDLNYKIKSIEYIIKENTYVYELKEIKEEEILENQKLIKKEIKQPKIEKISNVGKFIIQSRERLPEKNNKWSNWLNNTPCNNLEDAESMLKELKNTETKSLQFRICDKSKNPKELIEENLIEKEPKKSEVVEKPYIVQYKERDKTTGVFSNWKLLERFETPEKRNEFYEKLNREPNKMYTIKNVRVTRQHLSSLLED